MCPCRGDVTGKAFRTLINLAWSMAHGGTYPRQRYGLRDFTSAVCDLVRVLLSLSFYDV